MKQETKLEEAKRLYQTANADQRCVLESLFPELKESEYEKNIKNLIDELKCSLRAANCQNEACNGGHEKRIALLEWAIAWIEKQDSYYTFEIKKGHWYKCVCDYMLNGSDLMFKNGRLYYCRSDWRLGGEIDERNVKDIGVHGYKSFFRPATNQEIKDWIEKQGKNSPVLSNSLNIGKKEIKGNKGEISPKWTDDDEQYLLVCKNALRKYQASDKWDADIISKWLEDKLKQREQKLKWSEEDDCYMSECISAIATKDGWSFEEKRKTKHWLESLKQRMEE